jgi:Acyl carrier protein
MIKKELESKLKGQELTLESTFKDLGLDSLDLVDLVFKFEEELGIEFDDEDLTGLKTVSDVVQLIESKQK